MFKDKKEIDLGESRSKKPRAGASKLESWLSLIRSRRWSRRQKYALLTSVGNPSDVMSLTNRAAQEGLLSMGLADNRLRVKPKTDASSNVLASDLAFMRENDVSLITMFDAEFPSALREIDDPPIALFAKGDLGLLAMPKVAIVGSRKPSPVGSAIANRLSGELAGLGVAIVSGLAMGIDANAHQGALTAQGSTIAVLGAGIDVVYPAKNRHLFELIETSGLILSEYSPAAKPTKYSFPDRNRLVSGLSLGVVIVEAAERSGTLITARLALEQNRELMVVPGAAVSHQYGGSHRLLREGAALVSSSSDVLEELASVLGSFLNESSSAKSKEENECVLDQTQSVVYDALDYVPLSVDAIVIESGLPHSSVVQILLELEMLGVVASSLEGGYIRRA